MSIPIHCDECGWESTAKDSFAGREVTCKRCGESIEIPLPADVIDPEEEEEDWEEPDEAPVRKKPSSRRERRGKDRRGRTGSRKSSRRTRIPETGDFGPRWIPPLVFLSAGILGVALVRFVFLDTLQVIGWSLFWEGLSRGHLMELDFVFKSKTFAKCALGFLTAGSGGGLAVSIGLASSRRVSWVRPGALAYAGILFFSLPLFVVFLVDPWDGDGSSTTDSGARFDAPVEPPPIRRLSVTDISDVYERSQQEGNEEFAGRVIEIEGEIQTAYTLASLPEILRQRYGSLVGSQSGTMVKFKSGGWNYEVLCHVPDRPRAKGLRGKTAVIRGTCVGIILQSGILFRDGEIVETTGESLDDLFPEEPKADVLEIERPAKKPPARPPPAADKKWNFICRTTFEYDDEHGLLLSQETRPADPEERSTWHLEGDQEFTYYKDGDLRSSTTRVRGPTGSGRGAFQETKTVYNVDTDGFLGTIEIQTRESGIWRDGPRLEYRYDKKKRIGRQTIRRGDRIEREVEFHYDGKGRLKKAEESAYSGYYQRNRLYVYDDSGRLKEKTLFSGTDSGSGPPASLNETYAYDEKGRLAVMTTYAPDQKKWVALRSSKWTYKEDGKGITEVVSLRHSGEWIPYLKYVFVYDEKGRLTDRTAFQHRGVPKPLGPPWNRDRAHLLPKIWPLVDVSSRHLNHEPIDPSWLLRRDIQVNRYASDKNK